MAGTRASTRNANSSSPVKGDNAVAGTKRKQESESSPKRSRKTAKKQTTIDEMIGDKKEDDSEMKDTASAVQGQDTTVDATEKETEEKSETKNDAETTTSTTNDVATDQINGDAEPDTTKNDSKIERLEAELADAKKEATNGDAKIEQPDGDAKTEQPDGDVKAQETDGTSQEATPNDESKPATDGDNAVEESSQREKQMPTNIIEKGLIYFFTRNRVSIDDASSVGDLQRTFFVLRPLPTGAKLGEGTMPDSKNNRLMALPKKVFPKSSNDKFMAFVEKANTTIQDLKENFFKGDTYETKTQGTRENDPVTPVAEGVYTITRTEDATTHLVYSTTIPSELGEVQEDLGIKDQGSFIISVKNPERSGPASAALPQKPAFSKEIIEDFRGLAWAEVKPTHLNHEYCQILLIGEKAETGMEPTTKDQKHDKDTPQEELEKLEHEDELRVQHLHGDDSVFDDLKISKEEFSKVPTTW